MGGSGKSAENPHKVDCRADEVEIRQDSSTDASRGGFARLGDCREQSMYAPSASGPQVWLEVHVC